MYIETWYKIHCPNCKTKNWFCDGDTSDCTSESIEAIECYKCSKKFWLYDPINSEYSYMLEEYHDIDGNIFPAKTPDQILEQKVDPTVGVENPS